MHSPGISRFVHLALLFTILAFAAASPAFAAELSGKVWIAGSEAVAVGAEVSVGPEKTALVDKNGHYRIKAAPSGWLVMRITTKDKQTSTPLKVKVSGITRANIELAPNPSGSGWILRRR